jgi:transposase
LPEVKTGGRPEKPPRRAVLDAVLYVVRTGCSWRQLPADFPPWQTVCWYFVRWEQAKVTEKILPVVREQLRLQEGRNPEPSAGLIDSQTVKGADTVGRDSRGYDAGKKINGRKRFIVTDTLGLLLIVVVVTASTQDRDGAKPVLLETYAAHHSAHRAQARRPARLRRDPAPVGGRANARLDHRAPPPGPGLRTRPRHVRGHDPLGRDQHHHPPHRPRGRGRVSAETRPSAASNRYPTRAATSRQPRWLLSSSLR